MLTSPRRVAPQFAGLGVCLLLIDWIGRRRCLWLFLLAVAAAVTPFLRHAAVGAAADADPPLDTASLFFTRLFSYAAFIVLYIYTPELYPTRVRSFAFGLFNAFCRFGGLVAPFIAVDLATSVRCPDLTSPSSFSSEVICASPPGDLGVLRRPTSSAFFCVRPLALACFSCCAHR